jgi:spore germination protein KC
MVRRSIIPLHLILLLCCLLTGCLGSKEIQDQAYITSIGFDVEDEQIIVYFQALSFANIAKKEGGEPTAAPILIGRGKGSSIEEAFNHIEQTTAVPLHYGQINTLVISEKAMEKWLNTILDFMGRNSFLRYTTWTYGTNESIQDIFEAESFFGQPPLYSIIHRPITVMKENSFLPVVPFHDFIGDFYEPVGASYIPSIYINKENWQEDKEKKLAAIDGLYVFSEEKYKGKFTKDDMEGLKWFIPETNKIYIPLKKLKVSVQIVKPKVKIKLKGKDKPVYNVEIDVESTLDQNVEGLEVTTIEKQLEKKIKKQVMNTYEKALEKKIDIYNLTRNTYRFHHKRWDVGTINDLSKDSLKVKVNVFIPHTGDYKK